MADITGLKPEALLPALQAAERARQGAERDGNYARQQGDRAAKLNADAQVQLDSTVRETNRALADIAQTRQTVEQQQQANNAATAANLGRMTAGSVATIGPAAGLYNITSGPEAGQVWERPAGGGAPERRPGLEAAPAAADVARRNTTLSQLASRSQADGPQFVDGSRWLWREAGTVDGGTVVAAQGGGYWQREYSGPVDLRWFGAEPDGADCTAAMTAALAAHRYIYVPPGTWHLDELALPADRRVTGAGRNTTILRQRADGPERFAHLADDSAVNVQLADLQLRGPGRGGEGKQFGLYLHKDTLPPGVPFDSQIRVRSVDVTEFPGDGVYLGNNCRGGIYEGMTVYENGGTGWNDAFGSDNHMREIVVFANGKHGFRETGGANFYLNCKAFANGEQDRDAYQNWHVDTGRAVLLGCESQESFGDGWYLRGQGIVALGCVADSSGIDTGDQTKPSADPRTGIICDDLQNSVLQFVAKDFRREAHPAAVTQGRHLTMTGACVNVDITLSTPGDSPPNEDIITGAGCIVRRNGQVRGAAAGAWLMDPEGRYLRRVGATGALLESTPTGDTFIGEAGKQTNIRGAAMQFFDGPAGFKPSVTGSRGGNTALQSLIAGLASIGLVTDNTTS